MPYIITHSKTMPDGRIIDVLKLYLIIETKETIELPLEKIIVPKRSKKSGYSSKRSNKAKTEYPLIVTENGFIVDGRHRFFKLLDNGKTTFKVKVVTDTDLLNATVDNESELTKQEI